MSADLGMFMGICIGFMGFHGFQMFKARERGHLQAPSSFSRHSSSRKRSLALDASRRGHPREMGAVALAF